jgi:hypothetical protein
MRMRLLALPFKQGLLRESRKAKMTGAGESAQLSKVVVECGVLDVEDSWSVGQKYVGDEGALCPTLRATLSPCLGMACMPLYPLSSWVLPQNTTDCCLGPAYPL